MLKELEPRGGRDAIANYLNAFLDIWRGRRHCTICRFRTIGGSAKDVFVTYGYTNYQVSQLLTMFCECVIESGKFSLKLRMPKAEEDGCVSLDGRFECFAWVCAF
jgi:hypothetical protein